MKYAKKEQSNRIKLYPWSEGISNRTWNALHARYSLDGPESDTFLKNELKDGSWDAYCQSDLRKTPRFAFKGWMELCEWAGLPEPTRPRYRNQDSRNRWAKAIGAPTMDAGKLLEIMRPEVEAILVNAGFFSPPSQSARVSQCLTVMEEWLTERQDVQDQSSVPELNMKQRFQLQKTIRILKAFQAVHRTITILEGTVI